jgi:mannose-1-phosphate guanylyltransferase
MTPSNGEETGEKRHGQGLRINSSQESLSSSGNGSFWAVIPAGGSGTRLWPVSRSRTPKFLISFIGDTRSLLQQTVDRLRFAATPDRMLIVCGPSHAASISVQVCDLLTDHIVVEPVPRGTCPAIALAAAIIERQDPDAVMGSFAADHAVSDPASFEQAVNLARDVAARGYLVTIGCRPTRPETGYGYIAVSDQEILSTGMGASYRVDAFVEKPDSQTAMRYLESGRYLWNSGMFVWKASTFMEELRCHEPGIADGVERIASVWGTARQQQVTEEIWPTLHDISVDNGVMERSRRVAVVPAEFGWSDVGDWHGLSTLLEHDESGNCTRGDTINIGSVNSMVWSDTQRVISIIGLEDVVIVDTPDALLVANRAHAQLVRSTVSKLKEQNRPDLY